METSFVPSGKVASICRSAEAHQLRDALATARTFKNLEGDDRDRFGTIQLQAARQPTAVEVCGDHDEEFFLLARREGH